MARIICDPAIADAVDECEVVQKLSRCCDVFGVESIEVYRSLTEIQAGDCRLNSGEHGVIRAEYLTWFRFLDGKLRYQVGQNFGSINWAFSQIFFDHSAELHTMHGLTDNNEYDYLTTVCIRVCVGEDGWPMVRIHWSDADTHLWEDWYQSDREAVDMATAVCRQPESEGIYLDWLEDRLGVCLRDRDEMMRYIADTNGDTNGIEQLTQVI